MSTDYSSRTREYYLILPAKTGPEYGGGWAPGSVIAHWFHLKKGFPGVFWVWGLSSSGIRDEDKLYFENLIDPLGKHFKINGRQICISRKGYIYEAENHSITWEFEASYIIKDAELSSEAEKRLKKDESCIPLFRKEYLRPELWGSWLLIRDLKQLVEPISGKKFDALYSFPDCKYFSNKEHKLIDLTTSHLASGNAFVSILPKKLETKDPKPEVEISEYLRQFLSDSPPKGKLRESNIHDALIFQLLKKGYYFLHEKAIKNGRYDSFSKIRTEN